MLDLPGWLAQLVAEALGHAFEARQGLVLAAARAAAERWPADASVVVPSVPGRADADRDETSSRASTT